jgi:hypothetical protein
MAYYTIEDIKIAALDAMMEIISGAKIPFIKWKALDSVLEGKQEEAS